jgi:hypothetical protein
MARNEASIQQRREYSKVYRRGLPRETKCAYYQAWYSKNREQVLSRNRQWRKDHPDYRGLRSADYRLFAVNLLRQRDGDICGHCGKLIVEGDFGIDHEKPCCVGGTDEAANLRLVHKICNIRRERQTYGTVD